MQKEELRGILERSADRDIPEEAIPSLELYMDQIITLVERELSPARREEGERLLTKTMVNNYTKEGLVKRIKGKKYSREHIRMLLLVYQLKQSLAIQDVKKFLDGMEENLTNPQGEYDSEGTERLYRDYLYIKDRERRGLPVLLENLLDELEEGDGELDPARAVLALTALSTLCRRAAQWVIDDYYGPREAKK